MPMPTLPVLLAAALLTFTLPTIAEAGKLAQGFKGRPFNEIAAADFAAPADNCAKGAGNATDPLWVCQQNIGGVENTVHYLHEQGVFWGYMIQTREQNGLSTWEVCTKMMDVYEAAYGDGRWLSEYRTAPLDQKFWTDGSVRAMFSHEPINNKCQLLVYDNQLMKLVENRRKIAASKAVNDL
jgi:hypothetical protein